MSRSYRFGDGGPASAPAISTRKSAAEAAALIAQAIAIPIHWGTFALARPARRAPDPERPAREFAELTKRYAPHVDVLRPRPRGSARRSIRSMRALATCTT